MPLACQPKTRPSSAFKFNTAIDALMGFTNALVKAQGEAGATVWEECRNALVRMLSPIVPGLADELWRALGRSGAANEQPWPVWDETLAAEQTVTIVVQVNGRRVNGSKRLPESASKNCTRWPWLARRCSTIWMDDRRCGSWWCRGGW